MCLLNGVKGIDELDQYCLDKQPKTQRTIRSKLSYVNFLRMCSSVKQYSNCLVNTRFKPPKTLNISYYELQFPISFDIYRAGYEFCTKTLPNFHRDEVREISDNNLYNCEQLYKVPGSCKSRPGSELMNKLKAAIDSRSNDASTLACKASVDHYKCLEDAYRKGCNESNKIFFVYFFARLGGACLKSEGVSNDLVLKTVCKSRSTSGAGGLELGYVKWTLVILISMLLNLGSYYVHSSITSRSLETGPNMMEQKNFTRQQAPRLFLNYK
ncbi:uncharacterized protein LOC106053552 isoform X2 [Biomphalaria glabrata]|nr:uncharacterized protein LOC106053552 isoform X2 [Biomphalaria glabrata]KAI8752983.1 hypothetical protein BgiMline_013538 [Biomphalaria glabrata]